MSGEIGDFVSISNSIEIGELQRQQNTQLRLAEFRERADALARQTGIMPLGFFAFEKAHPTAREVPPNAKWGYAALGAFLGFIFGFNPVGAVIGGMIGFGIGVFVKEPESVRLNRAMDHYNGYLTEMETVAYSRGQGRGNSMDQPSIPTHTRHAENLRAREQQEASAGPSI